MVTEEAVLIAVWMAKAMVITLGTLMLLGIIIAFLEIIGG